MKTCHGCQGAGWVDSQYKGAVLCPVCSGSGQINGSQPSISGASPITPPVSTTTKSKTIPDDNKNPLLREMEEWLRGQYPRVILGNESKTMNTYKFTSNQTGKLRGLAWISTDGPSRIYLAKGAYSPVDNMNRIRYIGVLGGYPQFKVQTPSDIEYAKRLITHALNNF